jgi:uncharacterized membrane protein
LGLVEMLKQSEMGELLITLVVAMLPVLELRGAIPLGVSMGLHPWAAMLVSVIGNILPAPFIILFVRPIFTYIRRRSLRVRTWVDKLVTHAEGKWDQVHQFQFWGLALLVAIPLPGTGAWTGALIAAVTNMRLKFALPAIILGVIVAGFVITGMTVGFTAIFS